MENYSKARTVEQPSVCPFPDLPADTPQVRVRDSSKIRNLLRYALSRMEAKPRAEEGKEEKEEEEKADSPPEASIRPPCSQLVFTGSGKAVSKTITCTEIMKRRVKGLHQLTRLQYRTAVEEWEPLEPDAGLDALTVSRNLPDIWILLSTQPLDRSQPGYQPPGRYDALWAQSTREEGGAATGQRTAQRRKRGGGERGGGGGGGRGKGSGWQTGRSREQNKGTG